MSSIVDTALDAITDNNLEEFKNWEGYTSKLKRIKRMNARARLRYVDDLFDYWFWCIKEHADDADVHDSEDEPHSFGVCYDTKYYIDRSGRKPKLKPRISNAFALMNLMPIASGVKMTERVFEAQLQDSLKDALSKGNTPEMKERGLAIRAEMLDRAVAKRDEVSVEFSSLQVVESVTAKAIAAKVTARTLSYQRDKDTSAN